MAIYKLIQHGVFGPEQIERMTAAYEEALTVLGITDRQRPMTETIALKIVEVTRTGERDPSRICALALEELQLTPLPIYDRRKIVGSS